MPTNNWGPYQAASNLEYQSDGGTPPPTGSIVVPQSPLGSVTGESATFNNVNTITSTEEFLADVVVVDHAQQGSPALTQADILADQPLNVSSRNLVNLGT